MTIEAQKVKFTKEGAVTVNAKNIDEIIIREVPNEQIGWKSGAVSPSWEQSLAVKRAEHAQKWICSQSKSLTCSI
jgi:hypothetical protein